MQETVQKLVKGNCPKCGYELKFAVKATTLFGAIISIDTEWKRAECPNCHATIEMRAKPI